MSMSGTYPRKIKTLKTSVVGSAYHVAAWITSSLNDVVYQNPRFTTKFAETLLGTEWENGVGVFYIHGTADRVSAFDYMAREHLRDLPPMISGLHLISFEERARGLSILDFRDQLLKKIKEKRLRKVFLFGHSRGGLVAAALALVAVDFGIEILGIYTFGTPFGGSDLALAPLSWVSSSVAEMRKKSDFLKKLNLFLLKSTIPMTHFVGTADELVSFEDAYVQSKHLGIDDQKQLSADRNQVLLHMPFTLLHHSHLSMTYSARATKHSLKRMHELCPVVTMLKDFKQPKALDDKKQDQKVSALLDQKANKKSFLGAELVLNDVEDDFVQVDCKVEKFIEINSGVHSGLASLCSKLDIYMAKLNLQTEEVVYSFLERLKISCIMVIEGKTLPTFAESVSTIDELIDVHLKEFKKHVAQLKSHKKPSWFSGTLFAWEDKPVELDKHALIKQLIEEYQVKKVYFGDAASKIRKATVTNNKVG